MPIILSLLELQKSYGDYFVRYLYWHENLTNISNNPNKYKFLFTRFTNKIIGEEFYTQLNV
eukprot:UN00197